MRLVHTCMASRSPSSFNAPKGEQTRQLGGARLEPPAALGTPAVAALNSRISSAEAAFRSFEME